MPSLLVVIFVVELAVQLVNTIGATTINNLVRKPCVFQSCIIADSFLDMAPLPRAPDTARQAVRRPAAEAKGIPGRPPRPQRDEQPGRVCQVGEAAAAARQAAGGAEGEE
jgi:hypothetical protein